MAAESYNSLYLKNIKGDNGLPLSIRSLPRTLSQTFLSQLKAVLFGCVGVGAPLSSPT